MNTLGHLGAALLITLTAACGGDAEEAPLDGDAGADTTPDADTDDDTHPGTDAKLSFQTGAGVVSFDGMNNASYYQEAVGQWQLTVVVNDVLGDKYFSLSVRASDGTELEPGTYDCSKAIDDAMHATAKMTFNQGSGAAEKEWRQAVGKPCSITVSAIGDVGGRLAGSFSATLAPDAEQGGDDLVVSGGTFDVERKEF
jgi:hypothetical protein